MEVYCYLCNSQTEDFCENFSQINSKHTQTPIAEYIIQFLGDFISKRNVYDEANCMCMECVSRIHAYDWSVLKAKEQEKVLSNLLMKTETTLAIEEHSKANVVAGLIDICNRVSENDPLGSDPLKCEPLENDEMTEEDVTMSDDEMSSVPEALPVIVPMPVSTPEPTPVPGPVTTLEPKPLSTALPPQVSSLLVSTANSFKSINRNKPIIVRVLKRLPLPKSTTKTSTNQSKSTEFKQIKSIKQPWKGMSTSEMIAMSKSLHKMKRSQEKQSAEVEVVIQTTCDICGTEFENSKLLRVCY